MIKNWIEVLYTRTHEDGSKEEKTCRQIFELETKLFPCLVDMKFKGVKIDVEKATEYVYYKYRKRASSY